MRPWLWPAVVTLRLLAMALWWPLLKERYDIWCLRHELRRWRRRQQRRR